MLELNIKTRFSYSDQSIKHSHRKTRQSDQRLGVGVYDTNKTREKKIHFHQIDDLRMEETKINQFNNNINLSDQPSSRSGMNAN